MLWHVPGLAGCVDKGLSRGQDRVWLDLTQAAVCGKKDKNYNTLEPFGSTQSNCQVLLRLFNVNLIYISGICQESKNATATSFCTNGETGIMLVVIMSGGQTTLVRKVQVCQLQFFCGRGHFISYKMWLLATQIYMYQYYYFLTLDVVAKGGLTVSNLEKVCQSPANDWAYI